MSNVLTEEVGLPLEVTVKQLLEAGVHFGHYTNRWNPKMARYIYTDRNKVYIIDLEQTLNYLTETAQHLADIAAKGGTILFVGTKRQAQQAILGAAQKTGMPYVNHRWLGGMLTNFETVRKSVAKLDEIEKMEAEGTYQFLTKKEVAGLRTQRDKLLKVLVGVRNMKKLPDALFVVDPKQEEIAVREARRLSIPVAAIIDTNCDPDVIDHCIPGNDDAIRSVQLICEVVGSAVEEGRNKFRQLHPELEPAKASDADDSAEGAKKEKKEAVVAASAVTKAESGADKASTTTPVKAAKATVTTESKEKLEAAKSKPKKTRAKKSAKESV